MIQRFPRVESGGVRAEVVFTWSAQNQRHRTACVVAGVNLDFNGKMVRREDRCSLDYDTQRRRMLLGVEKDTSGDIAMMMPPGLLKDGRNLQRVAD